MIISENAYLILGLSCDANEKVLNKRYKEILKVLEIDEVPEYENDLSFIDYKSIRTSENIKLAFHELSNQKKKIYQDFLWFQLVTGKDEKLFKMLCEGDIIEAIDGWGELYKETGKFHYLKNYVIALLLSFENQKNFDDLDFSGDGPEIVRALHECIKSEKFWREFFSIISLSTETSISDIEMNRFKTDMPQYLAEEIFDLAEELKTPKLYIEFNKVFGLSAKELDDNKNVTKPLGIIDKNSKKIKELNLGEDLDEIIDLINEIEEEVKKLDKIGINKNSRITKIVDDISMQIRNLGIELCNVHNDKKTAIEFINEAISLLPSEAITKKLKKDLKDIESIEIEHKAFERLFELIDKGKKHWDDGKYADAVQEYQDVINYVKKDLKDKFNLNEEYLNVFKEKVESRLNLIYPGMPKYELENVLGDIENVKNYIKDGGGFHRGNLHIGYLNPQEQIIYFMYIDAVQRVVFGKKLQSVRNTYNPGNSSYSPGSNTNYKTKTSDDSSGCIWWVIGLIILFWIIGINS